MILSIFELCWWKKAIKLILFIQKVKYFFFLKLLVDGNKWMISGQFNFIIINIIVIIIIIIPAG